MIVLRENMSAYDVHTYIIPNIYKTEIFHYSNPSISSTD